MAAVVTNTGLAGAASRLNGAGAEAAFDYIAVGTGTTAAQASDTILETEITDSGLARAQDASPTRETTAQTNDTAVCDYSFSVTGTKAVTETGLFNATGPPPAGVLLCRDVFSAINVINGDTLVMTIKVQVS